MEKDDNQLTEFDKATANLVNAVTVFLNQVNNNDTKKLLGEKTIKITSSCSSINLFFPITVAVNTATTGNQPINIAAITKIVGNK